ncbi:MAG: tetratricopeptide repeat protein [Rhodospirillales bacterium]
MVEDKVQSGSLAEARERLKARDHAGAGQIAETLLNTDCSAATKAGACHILAVVMAHEGRHDEAVSMLRDAVSMDGAVAAYRVTLGDLLLKTGGITAALGEFAVACDVEPDFAPAHLQTGNALARLGQFDKAENAYMTYSELRPTDPQGKSNLGNIAAMTGRPEAAVVLYEAALALEPDMAGVLSNLGNVLMQLDRPADAVARYVEALRLQPGNPAIRRNLGIAEKRLQEGKS